MGFLRKSTGPIMFRGFIPVDYWVLLHLDTLLSPQPFRLLENVKDLEWSDTPEKVHIAMARLDLYDSLADAGHEASKGHQPDPDPELLRVFLWSKDCRVCTRAFKWCLDLVPGSQSGTPGDVNSARMFNRENMGHEWIEHFIKALCEDQWLVVVPCRFLLSGLFPKWTMLPSSWCCDFASVLLFSTVPSFGTHGLPAYQCLARQCGYMSLDEQQAFLPFISTLLQLVKSSLNGPNLTSLGHWLAQLPKSVENREARMQIVQIMTTRKQQLGEETLGCFAELPMENEWLEETLELFAELPMAGEWMGE
jgi:hypothetical protein